MSRRESIYDAQAAGARGRALLAGDGNVVRALHHDVNNALAVVQMYGKLVRDELSAAPRLLADVDVILQATAEAVELLLQYDACASPAPLAGPPMRLDECVRARERLLACGLGRKVALSVRAHPVPLIDANPRYVEALLLALVNHVREALGVGTLAIEVGSTRSVTPGLVTIALSAALEDVDVGRGAPERLDDASRPGKAGPRAGAPSARSLDDVFPCDSQGRLGVDGVNELVAALGGDTTVEELSARCTRLTVSIPSVIDTGTRHGSRPPQNGRGRPSPTSRPRNRSPGGADLAVGVHPTQAETIQTARTVLLVEDEDSLRKAAGRVLRHAGWTVLDAANGREALDKCAHHAASIDLIVLDLNTPPPTGSDLLDRLRAFVPDRRVLVTSGDADGDDVRACIRDGVLFLRKPFSPTGLLEKIDEARVR